MSILYLVTWHDRWGVDTEEVGIFDDIVLAEKAKTERATQEGGVYITEFTLNEVRESEW
jgi:hypothetical protein